MSSNGLIKMENKTISTQVLLARIERLTSGINIILKKIYKFLIYNFYKGTEASQQAKNGLARLKYLFVR